MPAASSVASVASRPNPFQRAFFSCFREWRNVHRDEVKECLEARARNQRLFADGQADDRRPDLGWWVERFRRYIEELLWFGVDLYGDGQE